MLALMLTSCSKDGSASPTGTPTEAPSPSAQQSSAVSQDESLLSAGGPWSGSDDSVLTFYDDGSCVSSREELTTELQWTQSGGGLTLTEDGESTEYIFSLGPGWFILINSDLSAGLVFTANPDCGIEFPASWYADTLVGVWDCAEQNSVWEFYSDRTGCFWYREGDAPESYGYTWYATDDGYLAIVRDGETELYPITVFPTMGVWQIEGEGYVTEFVRQK